ncbi:helix-turn-helix domain-containing protein [Parahaliea mediterranea]|uniref:helix-turn-helix domain-containing protein n=1 Tax=Parahaliea mediterranea TaxID=651086 RepID=UPI001300645B|nr:helix-turn-helix domain-containing protein [Parahaliea mediterranea]
MSEQRDAANTLFRLLDGQPVDSASLDRASRWFEALDTPLDRRSFRAYAEALRRPLPADSPLAPLAPRWRRVWRQGAGFSAADADAFLQDYLSHLDPNLLFRAPITAGYARWHRADLKRGFAYGSQSEQGWSMLCCEGGGASLRAAGRSLALRPDTVLLVAPGALYHLQPLAGANEWRYDWVVFQPDSRWRDWLRWPEFSSQISALRIHGNHAGKIRGLFHELEHCLHAEDALREELSHNLLEQLILRCRACLPAGYQSQRDARIERAREFIQAHYTHPFSLDDVAQAASLSPSRLSGLFREQCGLSVLGYRDELRMAHAARLLHDSALGIADIGAEVGYPDPAYFSRTFSRHVGMSPRRYQQGESQQGEGQQGEGQQDKSGVNSS